MLDEAPTAVTTSVNVNMAPIRKPILDTEISLLRERTEMLGPRPLGMSRRLFLHESVIGNSQVKDKDGKVLETNSFIRKVPAERRDNDKEDVEAIARGKQVCGDFLNEVFDRAEKDSRPLTYTEMRGVYEIAKKGYNLLPLEIEELAPTRREWLEFCLDPLAGESSGASFGARHHEY